MIKPAVLDAMVAAGCTAEQIAAAVKADQAQSTNAGRQARFRARRKALLVTESNVTGVTETLPPAPLNPPLKSPPNPLKITPPISPQPQKQEARPTARMEFEAILSTILDPMRVEAIVGLRRKKGAVLTAHAANLLVKALSACQDIAAAADEMVLRNWTSVKPDWMIDRQHGPPVRKRTFVDVAMDRLNGKPNGSESIFSIDGDAQRIPADGGEHGPDDGNLRGGLARRFIASGH